MKKVFYFIIIAVPTVIILILLFLFINRQVKVTLPPPSGKYAVGRTTYEWKDTARIDSLAMDPGVYRELFVWVWYPAAKSNQVPGDYLPREWRKAIASRQGLFTRFFRKKLSKIQSHSIAKAKVAPGTTFPVILIKTGIGSLITDYTTIAENLASNGYIVVGTESPFSSGVVVYSDGRIVNDNNKGNPIFLTSALDRDRRLNRLVTLWSKDIKFSLDKITELNSTNSSPFYKRFDLNKVGIFGHALGGSAAFRYCFNDARCKAGISINGTPFGRVNENKLTKPFMFLMEDNSSVDGDSTAKQIENNIDSVYSQLPQSRVWMNIKGAKQYNFSDQALIRLSFLAKKAGDLGSINKMRSLEITSSCIQTFFDVHLKGLPEGKIEEFPKKYPEVVLKNK